MPEEKVVLRREQVVYTYGSATLLKILPDGRFDIASIYFDEEQAKALTVAIQLELQSRVSQF